ncbi:uncharacterized protein TrAtP1_010435 [Trichoderma atroviride]|uniref:Integrase zinc-binding domain-containing protein n=1 Tax=Hypocrea atroviridis (strain ATCC 20476 / IMI 206040) TaxID=452589 RepID=G9NQY2_HYPAI|nr:uncharacterized protein TRIATDRAFT_306687 [Trichoderma atroviride IMI 206040]EHK46952.1 hypothetical protein TRIATDRAFT_306687 [Trichoderma atroviride IMI 206040]UKZ69423.1 hypothetical protein TrAtP1_010435 [Trichoderma atroviride]
MENQYQEFHPFSREPEVQREFREYLQENTNKKHISAERKHSLIRWLADKDAKPQTQSDYSLRNYAFKTYKWDGARHILWGIGKSEKPEKPAKNGKGKKPWRSGKGGKSSRKFQDRVVVTEDEILNVVEKVHMSNDHGGWDATWDEVSSKYCGIVRSDVIFLLKRCYICTIKPRKQSRRNATPDDSPDESPASSSSAPGPSSGQQAFQQPLQFYGQQAPEQQDFDQVLDQYSQATFDYSFGNDFGNNSFQTDSFQTDSFQTDSFQTDSFQTDCFQTDSFQTDSFQYDSFQTDSFEGLDQLWNEEVPDVNHIPDMSHMPDIGHPAVGYPNIDMTNIDNIDPALLSNDFQNMSLTYTYPLPEEPSGSDTYPYDPDFMLDSV